MIHCIENEFQRKVHYITCHQRRPFFKIQCQPGWLSRIDWIQNIESHKNVKRLTIFRYSFDFNETMSIFSNELKSDDTLQSSWLKNENTSRFRLSINVAIYVDSRVLNDWYFCHPFHRKMFTSSFYWEMRMENVEKVEQI